MNESGWRVCALLALASPLIAACASLAVAAFQYATRLIGDWSLLAFLLANAVVAATGPAVWAAIRVGGVTTKIAVAAAAGILGAFAYAAAYFAIGFALAGPVRQVLNR